MATYTEPERSTGAATVPFYVRGLALGIPAILLGLQISGWISIFPAIVHRHSDFRQLYTAAYMIRTGHAHELYDYAAQKAFQDSLLGPEEIALPFLRPASQALLFVPLSFLPYLTAYVLFLIVNLVLLTVSYWLLRPYLDNLAKIFPWLPAAMFLTFLPVTAALMQGQDSLELLALFAASAVSLSRGRELAAGLLVGFGLFKFQIVLPIALLFLIWRRWRFFAGFALSAGVILLGSIWIVGLQQVANFARSLVSISGISSPGATGEQIPLRYSTYSNSMANLRGLIFNLADPYLSPPWIQFITIALSALVLLWVAKSLSRKQDPVDLLLVAITAAMVVSYYLFMHDISIILIPITLFMNRFIGAEGGVERQGRVIARISALAFVAPICMAFIPSQFYVVSLPLLAFLFGVVRSFCAGEQSSHNQADVFAGAQ